MLLNASEIRVSADKVEVDISTVGTFCTAELSFRTFIFKFFLSLIYFISTQKEGSDGFCFSLSVAIERTKGSNPPHTTCKQITKQLRIPLRKEHCSALSYPLSLLLTIGSSNRRLWRCERTFPTSADHFATKTKYVPYCRKYVHLHVSTFTSAMAE